MSYLIATVLNSAVRTLTPVEKWKAARRFDSTFTSPQWLIFIGIFALAILVIALIVVSYREKRKGTKDTSQGFFSRADKIGLSERERQILLQTARLAGLKQEESIFTMSKAFDTGTAMMFEESSQKSQTPEETEQLYAEMSSLREKLGFQKKSPETPASPIKPQKLSSRQIPVGKKIYLTRRLIHESEDLEAKVVKNDKTEFAVRLPMSIENVKGESWRVRYFFGTSVWEFDVSVRNCDNDILYLSHSDNIRFVNRRRFLRVPVKKRGLIASFQFEKIVDFTGRQSENSESSDGQNTSHLAPEFESAVVTELAGPGLRIESSLGVEVGQRVLVVFDLDTENEGEKTSGPFPTKIIEDIGVVRHKKNTPNGFSIAVELTGLGDSEVNELIQATNAAATKANGKNKEKSGALNTEDKVTEPAGSAGA